MPEERVVLTASPPDPALWRDAWLALEPLGAVRASADVALTLLDAAGRPVVTVLRPRRVDRLTEAARLLDVDAAGRPWWTDVVAGTAARLDAVVLRVAAACDGLVV